MVLVLVFFRFSLNFSAKVKHHYTMFWGEYFLQPPNKQIQEDLGDVAESQISSFAFVDHQKFGK